MYQSNHAGLSFGMLYDIDVGGRAKVLKAACDVGVTIEGTPDVAGAFGRAALLTPSQCFARARLRRESRGAC